ncbi:hypothetical protein N7497_002150 [Penicillium chrysogenum]|nr:hypothetical protein N7497_002150 [Penicillium chrysogenum]
MSDHILLMTFSICSVAGRHCSEVALLFRQDMYLPPHGMCVLGVLGTTSTDEPQGCLYQTTFDN